MQIILIASGIPVSDPDFLCLDRRTKIISLRLVVKSWSVTALIQLFPISRGRIQISDLALTPTGSCGVLIPIDPEPIIDIHGIVSIGATQFQMYSDTAVFWCL